MTAVSEARDSVSARAPGGGVNAVWAAAAVSSIGDGTYMAAAPLLAAFLTHDPRAVAIVSAASAAPWFLVGFWSGAVVDRLPRRLVLIAADCVRALGLAVLVTVVIAHNASILLLAATSFLMTAGKCFFDPAAQAIVPHLVGRDPAVLARINGRLVAADTAGRTVGPPLGGVAFSLGAWAPFAIDSISFVASAALVTRLPNTATPLRDRSQSLTSAIREGFVFLMHDRRLRLFAIAMAGYNVAYNLAAATFVLFVQDRLGLTAPGYGLLVTAMGVGAVGAGWISRPAVARLGIPGAVLTATVLQGLAWVALAANSSPWLAGCLCVVLGAASTLITVAVISARQHAVPDHLLGRVVSAFRLIGNGASPVGAALGGVVATAGGLRAPMVVAAVLLAVTASALTARLLSTRT